MVRQAEGLGIKAKFITEDAVFHPKFIEVGGKSTEGVFLTFANPPENQARRDFEKTYKGMWKVDKIGSYAYYAYDAAMIFMEAVKRTGSTDTVKVANRLRTETWNGITGEIKFDDKGDRKLAHIVWTVKGGQYVRYWDPMTNKYF